ncbi:hypothetical protein AGMMS50268_06150 [Spirochaetia bacterium]|nr:hypothetical protein AGMMS50268_06150 [Spirochaetia bacterium]
MNSKLWLKNIRDVINYNDSIFKFDNGHWKVINRGDLFQKYANNLFDDHLEKIKILALKVLSEVNPVLNSNYSFSDFLEGKIVKFSNDIRNGLAETLAYIGIYSKNFPRSSPYKVETIVRSTIEELFQDKSWKTWASLNGLLPILAEASPEGFLTSVQNALKQSPCPFDELFQREGKGITGENYLTGLYWALEDLSWSDKYLTHAILLLAELASHDPGGNYVNRPAHSIKIILMPWRPQTTATAEKRIIAMRGVQNNFPDVALKILMTLLPSFHQTATRTQKPLLRNFIPKEWKEEVSDEEYKQQVNEYANMLIELVKTNVEIIYDLIKLLDNNIYLPSEIFDNFLDYLGSEKIISQSDEFKQPIFDILNNLIVKHRRYSDAKWAFKTETVNKLSEISEKIKPKNPLFLYRRLFANNDRMILDDNSDWEILIKKIESIRSNALKEIYNINGLNLIIQFASTVENPYSIGFSLGTLEYDDIEKSLLPGYLSSREQALEIFTNGYINGQYKRNGEQWLDTINISHWSPESICQLLIRLPFTEKTWNRAEKWLMGWVENYWKSVKAYPDAIRNNLIPAIDKLIQYKRPWFALECIYLHYSSNDEFLKEKALRALLDGIQMDFTTDKIDTNVVTEIIGILQNDDEVNEDDMVKIEWTFFPILDDINDVMPKYIMKKMAKDTDFFLEIVKLAFKSTKKMDKEDKANEKKETLASNAWDLLHAWKLVPGTKDDGTLSENDFLDWLNAVKIKSIESGHFEVSMIQIGRVLFYTPPDANGLWINEHIAKIIDEKYNIDIRHGFESEIYNSRGVYSVDPSGKEEKEIAELWRKKAAEVERKGFIYFSLMLREIADSYEREATRNTNGIYINGQEMYPN